MSNRNRYGELARELARAFDQADQANKRIGRALKIIKDEQLYRDLGCSSFEHYLDAIHSMTVREANRLIRLSQQIEPPAPKGPQ